jgi:hypothetical protein
MKMRTLLATASLAAALLAPATSEAQEVHGLGSQTQLIISADRFVHVLSFNSTKETFNEDPNHTETTSGTATSILLGTDLAAGGTVHTIPRVGFDFAIIPHLTIGGGIPLAFTLGGTNKVERDQNNQTVTVETDAPSVTVIGIAPRVGYILGFSDLFGLWLRGGVAFYSVRTSFENQNNNTNVRVTNKDSIFSLDLDPQFIIVPMEHFFINVGLLMNVPITGSRTQENVTGNTTRTVDHDLTIWHFGASAGLGGWFNL